MSRSDLNLVIGRLDQGFQNVEGADVTCNWDTKNDEAQYFTGTIGKNDTIENWRLELKRADCETWVKGNLPTPYDPQERPPLDLAKWELNCDRGSSDDKNFPGVTFKELSWMTRQGLASGALSPVPDPHYRAPVREICKELNASVLVYCHETTSMVISSCQTDYSNPPLYWVWVALTHLYFAFGGPWSDGPNCTWAGGKTDTVGPLDPEMRFTGEISNPGQRIGDSGNSSTIFPIINLSKLKDGQKCGDFLASLENPP
ncbi:hypothetical protein ABW19_dt0202133 [Dactylella cylindrospora]|nr:hypothetical protein ABW19_dt0202133 [Dactylella cylindrospora]